MMAKPMSSKAKTAKVGPDRGLVVNPSHPAQSKYWDDAIEAARKSGNTEELAWLEKNRQKAVETWDHYAMDMLHNNYQVNPKTGVVEYVEVLPDGSTKTWKGIHGDYDLHGAYRKAPDGTMENVSFGSGQKFDSNGFDVEGTALRQQLGGAARKALDKVGFIILTERMQECLEKKPGTSSEDSMREAMELFLTLA